MADQPSLQMPTRQEIEHRIVFRLAGQRVPLTDFTTISATRILISEMIVEELLRLYAAIIRANADWFLDTDSVAALDRRLADFEQTRPGAQPAFGQILVSVTADTEVAAGTVVRTNPQDGSAPKRYAVDLNRAPDATFGDSLTSVGWHIAAGTARYLPVTALDAGPGGNTGVRTVTVAETNIPNLTPGTDDLGIPLGLSNPSPIEGGRSIATNPEYLEAFRDYLASLNEGTRPAIVGALRGWAAPGTTAPRVLSAAIDEWDGTSLLRSPDGRTVGMVIYIDGGLNGRPKDPATGITSDAISGQDLADGALVAAVQSFLRGQDNERNSAKVAAGVPFQVVAAKSLALPIDLNVWTDTTVSTATAVGLVTNAILNHFAGLPCAGRTILGELQGQFSLARLNRDILDIPAVQRVVFNAPTTTDRSVPLGFKAVAGRLTIRPSVVT